jgi:hypothetical protein
MCNNVDEVKVFVGGDGFSWLTVENAIKPPTPRRAIFATGGMSVFPSHRTRVRNRLRAFTAAGVLRGWCFKLHSIGLMSYFSRSPTQHNNNNRELRPECDDLLQTFG